MKKTYGYRWIILFVFALITIVIQIQWLAFAPIAREAAKVYNVSAFQIDLLSIIYMLVFLVLCIPASYIIDTYGIRIGIGTGAILIAIFGMLKGLFGENYTMLLISQTGLALAQPFILNSATRVAVQWFPLNERATAVGIATLAQFLGMIVAMTVTPVLIETGTPNSYDIKGMLMTYSIISLAAAVLLLIFLREHPPTPPSEEAEERFKVFEGIKHIFKLKGMRMILIIFFIGMGMFNAILTCIDQICKDKGLTMDHSGVIAGIMLVAGVFGALALPLLSDKSRKRKIFLIIGTVFMTPGLIAMTFATDFWVLRIFAFIFGFFFMGMAPVGFQYSAELSYPAPESSTQGLILLAGQISGILFVVGMNAVGMFESMVSFIVLSAVMIFLITRLDESPMILSQ